MLEKKIAAGVISNIFSIGHLGTGGGTRLGVKGVRSLHKAGKDRAIKRISQGGRNWER